MLTFWTFYPLIPPQDLSADLNCEQFFRKKVFICDVKSYLNARRFAANGRILLSWFSITESFVCKLDETHRLETLTVCYATDITIMIKNIVATVVQHSRVTVSQQQPHSFNQSEWRSKIKCNIS